jgi:sugar lactone lactonase YvrE
MSHVGKHNEISLHTCLPVNNILGEGIVWDSRQQCAFWTDISGKQFYRWDFDRKVTQYYCPERLCSFGLTPETDWFIAAFESGFAFFNPEKKSTQWLSKTEEDLPYTRMNDGKVDRQGRFWAGSVIEDNNRDVNQIPKDKQAKLYRLNENGQGHVIFDGIHIANGLSFSPDGKTMYFADSAKRQAWQSAFDPTSGVPSERESLFITTGNAFPDGSCIDSQGYLWNAQWGSSSVKRYTPSGDLDFTLQIDCQQPSCVSFGGPKLNHLIITSAREGLTCEEEKLHQNNGALFIYHTPYQGIAEPICTVPKRQQYTGAETVSAGSKN